nr:hypothetical protein [uncultured Psychroserpens sp.]
MNYRIKKSLLILFIVFFSCNKSSNFFIGKWQIFNVVENNESIDLVDNWIDLKSNGTFMSYDGSLEKKEIGKWTYLIEEKKIAINGDVDSQWTLSIKSDTLFFHSTTDNLYLIAKKLE